MPFDIIFRKKFWFAISITFGWYSILCELYHIFGSSGLLWLSEYSHLQRPVQEQKSSCFCDCDLVFWSAHRACCCVHSFHVTSNVLNSPVDFSCRFCRILQFFSTYGQRLFVYSAINYDEGWKKGVAFQNGTLFWMAVNYIQMWLKRELVAQYAAEQNFIFHIKLELKVWVGREKKNFDCQGKNTILNSLTQFKINLFFKLLS